MADMFDRYKVIDVHIHVTEPREQIGHTSCVSARFPSLGVMSTPSGPRGGSPSS